MEKPNQNEPKSGPRLAPDRRVKRCSNGVTVSFEKMQNPTGVVEYKVCVAGIAILDTDNETEALNKYREMVLKNSR